MKKIGCKQHYTLYALTHYRYKLVKVCLGSLVLYKPIHAKHPK